MRRVGVSRAVGATVCIVAYSKHTCVGIARSFRFMLLIVCKSCYDSNMNRATTPAPPTTKKKTEERLRTTILISRAVWKRGGKQAKRERRNFSNYVEWLIAQDVKANPEGNKA